MKHTMRSAFKRWCILHNEESRIRIPNWFRYYIRENTQWKYIVIDEAEDYYCNKCEMDYEQRRQYKGYYIIEISDEEINKWSQQGIEYFRGNPEAYSYFMGSGNSMIHMYKFNEDKEYYVVVSKDYESGEIEFEEEDYA